MHTVTTPLVSRSALKNALLTCGILASLLYVAMTALIPQFYEGYSSSIHTISELSAAGAPTRTLWVWPSYMYTLLAAAFGYGIWLSAARNRPLRVVGVLMIAYGIIGLAWPSTPMHRREILAAGGATISDTLHLVMATLSVVLITAMVGFGAASLDKKFRWYSLLTLLILLIFGGLTALDAPRVEANLLTPWAGLWERINVGAFLLWAAVLAMILLRKGKERE